MAISMFSGYTPAELRHAIGECSTTDTDSALNAAAILCSLVGVMQKKIDLLETRVKQLENEKERRDQEEELNFSVALYSQKAS